MPWEKRQLIADGFEPTYVDLEWYDGPRKGVALVDGVPHYYEGREYDRRDEADVYAVRPASEAAVAWEREQRTGLPGGVRAASSAPSPR